MLLCNVISGTERENVTNYRAGMNGSAFCHSIFHFVNSIKGRCHKISRKNKCFSLLQYCSMYCHSRCFVAVTKLFYILSQYCSMFCHSFVLYTVNMLFCFVTELFYRLSQYCSMYCHSILVCIVTVFFQVLSQLFNVL